MVSIANLSSAIVAFAFLSLVLIPNIFGGMSTFSIAFAGAILKFVESERMRICGFPSAVAFFFAGTELYAVGAISLLDEFWMGSTKAAPLFAYAFLVGFVVFAGILNNFLLVPGTISGATIFAGGFELQRTFAISVSIKIFSCFGLCLTTLGASFRGMIEAHRNLSFLCQAGDVSQTLPGISMGFSPVSIPHGYGVSQ